MSNTQVVDNPNETGSSLNPNDKSEFNLDDLAVSDPEVGSPNTGSSAYDDALPQKYQGKTPAEIAKMHSELEQRFGQQGNEVGELRKSLDTYILNRLQDTPTTPQPAKEEPVDFFDDPAKAVSEAISNSPEMRQVTEATKRAEQMALQQQLTSAHPQHQKFLADPKFQDWIKDSKIRQRMLFQADKQYDVEAAHELFTDWEGIQSKHVSNSQDVIESEKTGRKQAIKKASTGTARGNSSGNSSKKMFRRADIVELMKTDPRRYDKLAAEIRQAYADGRVK